MYVHMRPQRTFGLENKNVRDRLRASRSHGRSNQQPAACSWWTISWRMLSVHHGVCIVLQSAPKYWIDNLSSAHRKLSPESTRSCCARWTWLWAIHCHKHINAYYFFSFLTPLLFTILPDVWLGRFKTLFFGSPWVILPEWYHPYCCNTTAIQYWCDDS